MLTYTSMISLELVKSSCCRRFKTKWKIYTSKLVEIGGIAPLMKRLLKAGLLHGDCLTVTGKTITENLEEIEDYPQGQNIILPFEKPIKPDSHLTICYGNLAKGGSVAKIFAKEGFYLKGMLVYIIQKKKP